MRLAGFNASLTVRGVSVELEGSGVSFSVLVEELSLESVQGEIENADEEYARLHVLNSATGLSSVVYNSRLVTAGGGRTYTVLGKNTEDIKTVFRCSVEEPAA